jgi:hypothetical protein
MEEPVDIGNESRWQPVLPIPLTRVHFCTLHALVKVIEIFLYFHFMFIWNMSSPHSRELAIERMEKSLSAMGVHGGNVSIIKDQKRSGTNNSVAAKPSLNGTTAMSMVRARQSLERRCTFREQSGCQRSKIFGKGRNVIGT